MDRCRDDKSENLDHCHNPDCEQQIHDQYRLCLTDCGDMDAREEDRNHKWPEKILKVTHHGQTTQVWCWAAAIAMVEEYVHKNPVSDCDIASKLDRANGGDGLCCTPDGKPRDNRCFRGRRALEMTSVMKAYGLQATEFDRPLTWEELKHSIDLDTPVVAGLHYPWGGGHAVVIVGYREPSTIFVDDPWLEKISRPTRMSYRSMVPDTNRNWYSSNLWELSWYFLKDEVGGYLGGSSQKARKSAAQPAMAVQTGPARSKVALSFPLLTKGATQAFVQEQVERNAGTIRACYEAALGQTPPPASPVTMKLSFAVEHGDPSFIITKDGGGLPKSVQGCVTEAISQWSGLFPKKVDYEDSQVAEITFEQLPGANAPVVVPAIAKPAPKDLAGQPH